MGSKYRSSLSATNAWTQDQYQTANIIDLLAIINWRLAKCPAQFTPEPIERPGDKERLEAAKKKAREAKKKIKNTKWKDV